MGMIADRRVTNRIAALLQEKIDKLKESGTPQEGIQYLVGRYIQDIEEQRNLHFSLGEILRQLRF